MMIVLFKYKYICCERVFSVRIKFPIQSIILEFKPQLYRNQILYIDLMFNYYYKMNINQDTIKLYQQIKKK